MWSRSEKKHLEVNKLGPSQTNQPRQPRPTYFSKVAVNDEDVAGRRVGSTMPVAQIAYHCGSVAELTDLWLHRLLASSAVESPDLVPLISHYVNSQLIRRRGCCTVWGHCGRIAGNPGRSVIRMCRSFDSEMNKMQDSRVDRLRSIKSDKCAVNLIKPTF